MPAPKLASNPYRKSCNFPFFIAKTMFQDYVFLATHKEIEFFLAKKKKERNHHYSSGKELLHSIKRRFIPDPLLSSLLIPLFIV